MRSVDWIRRKLETVILVVLNIYFFVAFRPEDVCALCMIRDSMSPSGCAVNAKFHYDHDFLGIPWLSNSRVASRYTSITFALQAMRLSA